VLIHGKCHCGNISFILQWEPEPIVIPARACTCSFCTKHGAVWTSCPNGALNVIVQNPDLVSEYTFATGTAEFHICVRCGIVPIVLSRIDKHLYGLVNVNTFDDVDPSLLQRAKRTFEGEKSEARLERRKRTWIGQVEYCLPMIDF
jgi:hypothetical protein